MDHKFSKPRRQVARWIEQLQEYDFEIRHRQGKKHSNADALSRRPCEDCTQCNRMEERGQDKDEAKGCLISVTELPGIVSENEIAKVQRDDQNLNYIITCLIERRRPSWENIAPLSKEAKCYWAQWDSLVLENDILYLRWESPNGQDASFKLVLPEKLQEEAMTIAHSCPVGGHFGVRKTLCRLKEKFYWVNMKLSVENWCRSCDICAAKKGPHRRSRGALQQYAVGMPWERLAIDVLGPLPKTKNGNKYVIIIMDYFTKWPEAFALPDQEAESIAKLLVNEVISRYGIPLEIHSDQGRNFESNIFKSVCNYLGIRKTRTTALHPQSDGMVERFNRTLLSWLTKVLAGEQEKWDEVLPLCMLAYRTAVHEATGQTPSMLMLGRELRGPLDLLFGSPPHPQENHEGYLTKLRSQMDRVHRAARNHLQEAGDRMKTRYDRTATSNIFVPGTLVWLYNPQRKKGICPKLTNDWEGPFEVVDKIKDVVNRIRMAPRKLRVVHLDRLAKYQGENIPTWIKRQRQLPGRQLEERGE